MKWVNYSKKKKIKCKKKINLFKIKQLRVKIVINYSPMFLLISNRVIKLFYILTEANKPNEFKEDKP